MSSTDCNTRFLLSGMKFNVNQATIFYHVTLFSAGFHVVEINRISSHKNIPLSMSGSCSYLHIFIFM